MSLFYQKSFQKRRKKTTRATRTTWFSFLPVASDGRDFSVDVPTLRQSSRRVSLESTASSRDFDLSVAFAQPYFVPKSFRESRTAIENHFGAIFGSSKTTAKPSLQVFEQFLPIWNPPPPRQRERDRHCIAYTTDTLVTSRTA